MAASSSGLLSRIKFPWWRHNDMKASLNPVRDVYLHQWCGLCDKCRSSWCEFTIYPVIIFIIRYLLSRVSLLAHITLHFTSGIKRYPLLVTKETNTSIWNWYTFVLKSWILSKCVITSDEMILIIFCYFIIPIHYILGIILYSISIIW